MPTAGFQDNASGHASGFICFDQENKRCQANHIGRMMQLHQCGEPSVQCIWLLEMPKIHAVSELPMSGRLLNAIEELANAMCADGCTDPDSFLINQLANEVKDQFLWNCLDPDVP